MVRCCARALSRRCRGSTPRARGSRPRPAQPRHAVAAVRRVLPALRSPSRRKRVASVALVPPARAHESVLESAKSPRFLRIPAFWADGDARERPGHGSLARACCSTDSHCPLTRISTVVAENDGWHGTPWWFPPLAYGSGATG